MGTVGDLVSKIPGYFTVAEVTELEKSGKNTFKIKDATSEMVGQGTAAEEKPVIMFEGTMKKLVLNKARGNQLVTLFGIGADLKELRPEVILKVQEIQSRNQVVICEA